MADNFKHIGLVGCSAPGAEHFRGRSPLLDSTRILARAALRRSRV